MDDDVPTVWGFVYVAQFQLMPVCVFIANAMSVHLDSGHTGGVE